MRTSFAQRDFYANACFASAVGTADGVRLDVHVPKILLRGFRAPSTVDIPRSAVARLYRCGLFGSRALLVMKPETGLLPMMVSWRVVGLLGIGTEAARASVRWCRDVVRHPDASHVGQAK